MVAFLTGILYMVAFRLLWLEWCLTRLKETLTSISLWMMELDGLDVEDGMFLISFRMQFIEFYRI